eukprot:2562172-Pleurochrysis_carterae.AAC.5
MRAVDIQPARPRERALRGSRPLRVLSFCNLDVDCRSSGATSPRSASFASRLSARRDVRMQEQSVSARPQAAL